MARFGLAVAAVAAATLVRFFLMPLWGFNFPHFFFAPAVLVAALYGGFWPGLLSILLSLLAEIYFFIPPTHELKILQGSSALSGILAHAVVLAVIFFLAVSRRMEEADAERLRERIRQQQAVAEFGRTALVGMPLKKLMDEAGRILATHFDVKYCKILQYLPAENKALLISGYGWEPSLIGTWFDGTEPDSMSGFSLRSSEPVIARDLRKEGRFKVPTLLLEKGITSCINVVIPMAEHPFGLLEVDTLEKDRFSEQSAYILQAFANLIGDAIRHLRAEEEIRRKTEALVQSNEELEEFASIASHDLKEPLRKILTFSGRLDRPVQATGASEAAHYLEKIKHAAGRMNNLMDDLLLFSKIKTSKTLKLEPVDLNHLVEEVRDDLELRIEERRAEIRVEPLPTINGNYFQIQQLFLNLVSNSLKYCRPDAPPRVEIGARGLDNGFVEISVRDNGIGFEEKHLDKIFQPFRRLHSKDEFEGSGMGLAICKKIVEGHGGVITAKSAPGKGSTFYFTLREFHA